MSFAKIIAVVIFAASLMTPGFAWGLPLAIESPGTFAMSTPITTVVAEIISTYSRSAPPSRAEVDQLAVQVAKDVPSLTAALSAASDGSPPSYEAAVLLAVQSAIDSTCPLQGNNGRNYKNDDKKTAGKKKVNTAANSMKDCAAEHDKCLASCLWDEIGGLFGRRCNRPAPGTCSLVCGVVLQGCLSCNKKQQLHAADMGGLLSSVIARVKISSLEVGAKIGRKISTVVVHNMRMVRSSLRFGKDVVHAIVRLAVYLWTFVQNLTILLWTLAQNVAILLSTCVKQRVFLPVVDFFATSVKVWAVFAVTGWLQVICLSRDIATLRRDQADMRDAAREAEERRSLGQEDEAARRRQEHEINGQQDQDPNGNTGIDVVGNADNHGGNNDGLVYLIAGFIADRVQGILSFSPF